MRNFMKKYQGSGSGERYSLQRERQKMHFFQMQWEIKTKRWKTGIRQDCLIPGQEPGKWSAGNLFSTSEKYK